MNSVTITWLAMDYKSMAVALKLTLLSKLDFGNLRTNIRKVSSAASSCPIS